jgi:hypothetical protein
MDRSLYGFYIGLFPKAISYQRLDYNIFDLLGNVGGLVDLILMLFMAIVAFVTQFHIDLKLIDTFECLIDFDTS